MKGKAGRFSALLGLAVVLLFVAACGQKPAADQAPSSDHQGMSSAEHESMTKSEAGHGEAEAEGGHGEAEAEAGHGEAEAEAGHGGGHEAQTPIEEITDVPPLTTGSPVNVRFNGHEIEPRVIRLKAGEITFLVTNDDSEHAHNFRIARWDDKARPARGEIVEPGPKWGPGGKKREFSVRLDPGHYYVYCAQSDHEKFGMTGKLIIEP